MGLLKKVKNGVKNFVKYNVEFAKNEPYEFLVMVGSAAGAASYIFDLIYIPCLIYRVNNINTDLQTFKISSQHADIMVAKGYDALVNELIANGHLDPSFKTVVNDICRTEAELTANELNMLQLALNGKATFKIF